MTDRPHWTTLNLATLWLAVVAAENQRTGLTSLPGVCAPSPLRVLVEQTAGGVLEEPEVLEAAVVRERVAGATWDAIAAEIGTTAAAAELLFAPSERGFRLAEAFPVMRRDDAPGVAVLRYPDASRRWLLTALARRGTPEPRLAVDDATWRRDERQAVALMERTVEPGALPSHVDPAAALLDLAHRRAALAAATAPPEPAAASSLAVAPGRGARSGQDLSPRAQRRVEGRPAAA